jgi:hypothetical protein
VGNWWEYGHLGAHRVWRMTLKFFPTRVWVFFTNTGMGKTTLPIGYLLSSLGIFVL